MFVSKLNAFSVVPMVLGLLVSTVAATPGDVWSLSGDWSAISNPNPVDAGAPGGGVGTWEYHRLGAPAGGVPGTPVLYTDNVLGNLVGVVNFQLPDSGDGWYKPDPLLPNGEVNVDGNFISLIKFTVDSVPNPANPFLASMYVAGDVGGHADTGTTWTTDHAGTFLVEYLGYNARGANMGGLLFMDLIDPAGPTLLKRTTLNPNAPGNFPGKFSGSVNAVHESTILTLPAGGGVRFIMTNNDWSGMDMTITELVPEPSSAVIASLAAVGLGFLRRHR